MRLLIMSLAEAKLCTSDLELSLPLRSKIEEELQIARNERGKAPSLSFMGDFSPKFIFLKVVAQVDLSKGRPMPSSSPHATPPLASEVRYITFADW